MNRDTMWSACDYTPTATRLAPVGRLVADRVVAAVPAGAQVLDVGAGHGELSALLVDRGFRVTAIEPTDDLRRAGEFAVPQVSWVPSTGEDTGLPDSCADALVSSFGTIFCEPHAGVMEWARLLPSSGFFAMSAWDGRGFLAEMTRRMFTALGMPEKADSANPWGRDEFVHAALGPRFTSIAIEHRTLPWEFTDVAEGMRFYRDGSPLHAWMIRKAGARRPQLLAALETHLREYEVNGRIMAEAGYSLICARRA